MQLHSLKGAGVADPTSARQRQSPSSLSMQFLDFSMRCLICHDKSRSPVRAVQGLDVPRQPQVLVHQPNDIGDKGLHVPPTFGHHQNTLV